MSKLIPDADGAPLPAGIRIFRIGGPVTSRIFNEDSIERQEVDQAFFNPGSDEQRLSIFVESMTLPDQAWTIARGKPHYTHVACLSTDDVYAVVAPSPFHGLRPEWEAAVYDGSVDTRPGADGHAGIAGLKQGREKNNSDRRARQSLRSQLADKASFSPTPARHDIPDEQIRVAAYFIHEKTRMEAEVCWIEAIRQIRRQRVIDARQAKESVEDVARSDG